MELDKEVGSVSRNGIGSEIRSEYESRMELKLDGTGTGIGVKIERGRRSGN